LDMFAAPDLANDARSHPIIDAMSAEHRCDAARNAFVILYVADRDLGRVREEADYLRMFPGCEDVISREWRRLQSLVAKGRPAPPAVEVAEPHAGHGTLGHYRIERKAPCISRSIRVSDDRWR